MSQAHKIAGARRSNGYKALIETLDLSDTAALRILGFQVAPVTEPTIDPRVSELTDAGLTPEAAELAIQMADEPGDNKPSGGDIEAKPKTSEELGDELVETHKLTFTKGRVYLTSDMIEAAVRVGKTNSPEIVQSSGVGRTTAVLLFRKDSGDVAVQNLTQPA